MLQAFTVVVNDVLVFLMLVYRLLCMQSMLLHAPLGNEQPFAGHHIQFDLTLSQIEALGSHIQLYVIL